MSTVRQTPRRQSRRVRDAKPGTVWTPADVAEFLDVPEDQVMRALDTMQAAFFPRAWQTDEGWQIPAADVRRLLGGELEPLLSIRRFSELVGIGYHTAFRAVQAGHVRTVGPAWLSERRIPASEYWRFRGDRQPPAAATPSA